MAGRKRQRRDPLSLEVAAAVSALSGDTEYARRVLAELEARGIVDVRHTPIRDNSGDSTTSKRPRRP